MAWRLSPQLRILPGQNLAAKSFFVETADDYKDIALLDGPDAVGGVALYVAGYNLRKGTETAPIIDWRVHPGNANIIDDDPIAAGSTFLPAGKFQRQGLLFEIRGRDATTWVLRAKCRIIGGGSAYELGGSLTVSPLPANSAGAVTIVAGPAIG